VQLFILWGIVLLNTMGQSWKLKEPRKGKFAGETVAYIKIPAEKTNFVGFIETYVSSYKSQVNYFAENVKFTLHVLYFKIFRT
jgi:hypothetical protein